MDQTTRELLVYGYIKEHTRLNIPVTLITLCINFSGNSFNWVIYKNQLKNLKQGEMMKDTSIFLKDNITFHCVLFPNGWNEETIYETIIRDKGSSMLSLEMSSFPENILKYFVMYYELECKQFNIIWKGIDEFESNQDVASWNAKTLSSLQLIKENNNKPIKFEYKMKILYIKYKTWREYFIPCSMPKYIEFEWDLTDKLIKIIDPLNIDKINNETRYYSQNFLNDCWCLYIKRSKYDSKADTTNIHWNLGISLLKLPPKIKKISTQTKIFINDELLKFEDDDSMQFEKLLFSYSTNTKRGGNSYSFPVQETPNIALYDLFHIDPLKSKIKIRITIKDIYIRDRFGGVGRYERVKKKEWNQYHMIQ